MVFFFSMGWFLFFRSWFVLGRGAFGTFYPLINRRGGFDGMSFVLGWNGFVGKSFVLGWGVFANMGLEEIHLLSQAQFALVLCNPLMLQLVIIGTYGTCHGQNTKKHETKLNGKFASYKGQLIY